MLERFHSIPPVPIASFFFVMGIMGTRPIVPLYALEIGISPEELGILVAVFAIVPLVFASIAGSMMDRHGMGRALVLGALLGTAGLVLPFFAVGRLGLYVSQLVVGTGFTIFILAAQNQTGKTAKSSWAREQAIAVFSMGVALGSLFGPFIGGFVGQYAGYDWAFLILGLPALGAVVFVFPLISSDRSEKEARAEIPHTPSFGNPRKVLGYHRFMFRAILVSSLILMGKDMFVAYLPVYATSLGISASWIGIIIGLHNAGGVVVRYFLIPIVQAIGKNKVIMLSIAFGGGSFLLLPFIESIPGLIIVSVAIGLGLGIGQPLSISRTIALSPPTKVGEVLGFRLACNRFTQVVTPLAISGIVVLTGVTGVFILLGAILTLGSTRLSVPEEEERPA